MHPDGGHYLEQGQDMFVAYTLPVLKRTVTSEDGAYIDTFRLGEESTEAIVICHGFGGNKNICGLVALAQELAAERTVYTFDFRGHGLSPGISTFGYLEALDLKAVFDLVRKDGHDLIAALGFSMGGVALLRYAADYGGLASVITVSVPADLKTSSAPGARLIRKQMGNPLGRVIAQRRYKVKIGKAWKRASPPAAIVHKVSPLTLIHGEDDYIFEPDQARQLHRLSPGSRLRIFPRFGHAEQGYGDGFLSFVKQTIEEDFRRAREA
jgi:uncharacterized protein